MEGWADRTQGTKSKAILHTVQWTIMGQSPELAGKCRRVDPWILREKSLILTTIQHLLKSRQADLIELAAWRTAFIELSFGVVTPNEFHPSTLRIVAVGEGLCDYIHRIFLRTFFQKLYLSGFSIRNRLVWLGCISWPLSLRQLIHSPLSEWSPASLDQLRAH